MGQRGGLVLVGPDGEIRGSDGKQEAFFDRDIDGRQGTDPAGVEAGMDATGDAAGVYGAEAARSNEIAAAVVEREH